VLQFASRQQEVGMENLDFGALAHTLSKLMALAEASIEFPGGAIATERLIDYCSDELRRLSSDQQLLVLEGITSESDKRLLKDENGAIVGFMYSKKIFIGMRSPESVPPNAVATHSKPLSKTEKKSVAKTTSDAKAGKAKKKTASKVVESKPPKASSKAAKLKGTKAATKTKTKATKKTAKNTKKP
jgi:hypothetical protein